MNGNTEPFITHTHIAKENISPEQLVVLKSYLKDPPFFSQMSELKTQEITQAQAHVTLENSNAPQHSSQARKYSL